MHPHARGFRTHFGGTAARRQQQQQQAAPERTPTQTALMGLMQFLPVILLLLFSFFSCECQPSCLFELNHCLSYWKCGCKALKYNVCIYASPIGSVVVKLSSTMPLLPNLLNYPLLLLQKSSSHYLHFIYHQMLLASCSFRSHILIIQE
jgi:hypothetical protein